MRLSTGRELEMRESERGVTSRSGAPLAAAKVGAETAAETAAETVEKTGVSAGSAAWAAKAAVEEAREERVAGKVAVVALETEGAAWAAVLVRDAACN